MQTELVHPAALRGVWPAVRAGLDRMPPEDWIPEDVYHAIRSGESALYVGRDSCGQFTGFVVLRRLVAEFSGEVTCHVWLAYNAEGQESYDAAMALYRAVAKQMGASRITFSSPRRGWAKRFPITSATYEIPMEDTP